MKVIQIEEAREEREKEQEEKLPERAPKQQDKRRAFVRTLSQQYSKGRLRVDLDQLADKLTETG